MKKKLFDIWGQKGVGTTLLLACPLLLLLQFWRPYFFLTDDSFTLAFPVWVSVGQKIWAGANPFISQELFGGNYPLYRDAAFNVLWHPVVLLLSLFSPTFLRNALVDLYAMGNLLLAVAGFRWLLRKLGEARLTSVTPGFAVFLSLSYGFSMYSLLVGGSWFWYLANVAALPWLVGVWWEKRTQLFWVITVLSAYHSAVGGHPSCFVYSMLLAVAVGLWKAHEEREFTQILRYGAALLVAGAAASPSILPSLMALSESVRGSALPLEEASKYRMPFQVVLGSAFLGSGSILLGKFEMFGKVLHAYALASFVAGGLALTAFFRGRRMWVSWDYLLLGLLAAFILLVSRPDWLGHILYHVPVLNGMRWPFKEVFLVVFLLHLWAARGTSLPVKARNLSAFTGGLIFMASLTLAGSPSMNEQAASRRYFLDGAADVYWEKIRRELPPGGRVIPLMDQKLIEDLPRFFEVPLIMTGAGNFPAMYGVSVWNGYSAAVPGGIVAREPKPAAIVGIFKKEDRAGLQLVPGAVFLEWMDEEPGRIEMHVGSGPGREIWRQESSGMRRRPESNR